VHCILAGWWRYYILGDVLIACNLVKTYQQQLSSIYSLSLHHNKSVNMFFCYFLNWCCFSIWHVICVIYGWKIDGTPSHYARREKKLSEPQPQMQTGQIHISESQLSERLKGIIYEKFRYKKLKDCWPKFVLLGHNFWTRNVRKPIKGFKDSDYSLVSKDRSIYWTNICL